jgi:DNA-binding NarL/FixJ family response regulator
MDDFTIRVILADDHPAVVAGLLHTLKKYPTLDVVDTVGNSTELLAALGKQPCDVLVSDYSMPGGDYGDGIRLRRRHHSVFVFATPVSSSTDCYIDYD